MSWAEKCHFTAAIDKETGRRLMIKPSTNEIHPRCPECAAAELEHARLMILFKNDVDLVRKYEKFKKVMGK